MASQRERRTRRRSGSDEHGVASGATNEASFFGVGRRARSALRPPAFPSSSSTLLRYRLGSAQKRRRCTSRH